MKLSTRFLLPALASISLVVWAAGNFESPASTNTAQQFAAGSVQRQDTPTDSDYDCAELDTANSRRCSNLYDEHFDLFGFPSQLSVSTAVYADQTDTVRFGKPQISGYNAAGAWKIERGRPDVGIAILDTGIRWENTGLRTQVRLRCGELPAPRNAAGQTLPGNSPLCLEKTASYDLNGNGTLDVDDYANDARVNKNAGPNGIANLVDAQDLILAFSNGDDADGNGYKDDIAGWDFFDDDNDPYDKSSYFAAGNHGTGRTGEAVERGNDGQGSLGICPHCQFVPLRVWDTFVSDANTFCLAVTYAADNGVQVIEGSDGGLYHPAFCDAAVEYAHGKGAVMTFSGDDLNTGNHNYPANYNHVMLIEGTAPDTLGLGTDNAQFQQGRQAFCQGPLAGMCPGSDLPPATYFRGANTTQFGGHSSISMEGATGSVNTGKASGAAGLVMSAGLDFSPLLPLSGDEVREILEQTAEDVTQPNTVGAGSPDFAQAGWDSHFGYGRANVGAAVQAVKDGNIPPEASIVTPDWFAPLVGSTVKITGVARARRIAGGKFHYKVEWAAGLQPAATATWTVVKEADATGTVTDFGSIDLAAVRTAVAAATPPTDLGDATFDVAGRHPLKDHFTVRITLTDPAKPTALKGVDRKVLTAIPDGQGLIAGYPKRLGSGGEAPLRFADLNGDNVQELILPTEDGTIHAYQPDGSELPGWPVRTQIFDRALNHAAAPVFAVAGLMPPGEPPRGPTIADLDDDGRKQVVTAAGVRVYVFNADGTQRKGFPVRGDASFCTPDKQKQENLHPKCGFLATPSMARLDGPGKPASIVIAGLDGRLYAWHGDGTPVSWSPRLLNDVTVAAADRQIAESINNVAVGDLNADGKDDLIAATHEAYDDPSVGPALPGVPGAPSDVSFGGGTLKSTRVYAINGASGALMTGWPVHVSGLIQDVLPFIGPSHDPLLAKINGSTQVVLSATGTGVPGVGSGLASYSLAGAQVTLMKQDGKGPLSNITDTSGGLNLFESAVVGNLLGAAGAPLSVVKYQLGVADAANLLVVGQNVPYNHMIGAWDATTGVTLPAWPRITDDFQFLSSPTLAKMVAGTSNQVVAGTGLGLLHAYDGVTGLDVTGFPKVTGGWLFAPAALSDDGRIAAITREGYLFQWAGTQAACQTEWPSFRHDQQGSGNYDRDGTPPGAVTALTAAQSGSTVTLQWKATGDDAQCGTATRYQVLVDGVALTTGLPTPAAASTTQTLMASNLAAGPHRFTVQAVDEAGNLGFPVAVVIGNRAPLAALAVTPAMGTVPLLVQLDASASSDPDAAIGDAVSSYRFDFGDGTAVVTQAAPTISHSYASVGSYSASVTVADRQGLVSAVAAKADVAVLAVGTPMPPTTATPVATIGNSPVVPAATTTVAANGGRFGGGAFSLFLLPLALMARRRRSLT